MVALSGRLCPRQTSSRTVERPLHRYPLTSIQWTCFVSWVILLVMPFTGMGRFADRRTRRL